jgi:peptidoglycan/LPS O-acetylase OafA/YrhL
MNRLAREPWSLHVVPIENGYRPEVDGLRAIAVSAVIIYHFWNDLLPGGFLGVDMFFVISGYVITTSLARHPHDSIQDLFLGFYSRRIKRLLPALIVCVLSTCLLGALFIDPRTSEYSHAMIAGLLSLIGLSNIYFSWQVTDYFGVPALLNLFTHTWSLGVEEQFYLIFPALFWITGNTSRRPGRQQFLLTTLCVLTILSFSSYVWLMQASSSSAYFMMPTRFWELGLGCIIAVAPQISPFGRGSLAPAPWLAAISLVIALLAPADQQVYSTPSIVIGTAFLILTLRSGHPIYRLLTCRSVVLIGLMSYSLYLWHWSVLSISRWTVGVHWWSAPIQLGAILALAALSYVFVERPLRRATWSTSKLATIGRGLAAVICSAAAILVLNTGLDGVLYTGSPVRMSAEGTKTLKEDKYHDGHLQWRARDCIISSNDEVGKQVDARTCTLEGTTIPSKQRFLVIGNSFSAAEFEMYSVLSEEGIGSVVVTSAWGASPVPEVPNTSAWVEANGYYWRTVVPELVSHLTAGDMIIMINDLQGMVPATRSVEGDDRLALLKTGLNRLADELRQKGVQVIFQSSIPFIREAQCTPETAKPQWFNLGTSIACKYYTKSHSMERLRPLTGVLGNVASTNSNFHILDLFPVLCPDDICSLYNGQGVPLYRDAWSHLSMEANYLARPIFLSIVKAAVQASDTVAQGPPHRAARSE